MLNTNPLKYWLSCGILVLCCLIPIALLVIIIFDLDGWGSLVLELVMAFVVQAILAFLLTASGMGFLRLFKSRFAERMLSPVPMTALFSAGALLALPLIGLLQQRRLDILDLIQTAGLVTFFFFAVFFIQHTLHQASLADGLEPKPYDLPQHLIHPAASTQPHQPQPEGVLTAKANPEQASPQFWPTETDAYRELLELVGNDAAKANRLIESASHRAPNARREKWIRDSIVNWLRDS